jgi:peroxiredoxin Q/BCP
MGREYIGLHRTTFLIDEKGRIKSVITKPNTKNHTEQVLQEWAK